MATQATQIKLLPAEERELLTSRYRDIPPASARMASRVIESGARAGQASDLPYVLRRLLALEDEVAQLRELKEAAKAWREGITAAPWGSAAGTLVAAVDRFIGDERP